MKKLLCLICLCFLGIALSESAFAQKKTASGVVISSEDGLPVIGAAVTVKSRTGIGTVTDLDGNFQLDVPGDVKVLTVSYMGMIAKDIPVAKNQKVILDPQERELNEVEVVTTGIGQQDKRMFTGASTKIEAAEVQLGGMPDVSRSLEGRVAGVQVTNVSGTFGAAPKIRVRGATSIYGNSKPLWVVDGVIYEDNVEVSADDLTSGDAKTLISSAVAGLNSDDIESFTVLKDGSATSIYGARAMAGVIVITTKKGTKGHANVNYTGEFTVRRKPSYRDYNIMNSQEIMGVYREMEKKGWLQLDRMVNSENVGVYGLMFQEIRKYDSTNGTFGLPNTEAARNAYLQKAEFRNTDWFDLLFDNTLMQNHSVSISGGTERSQNYFSMSLMKDPGWYNRSSVERYTFNGSTAYDIVPNKLVVKLGAQGSHRSQQAPGSLDQSTDVVTGEVKRDFDINPFSFALNTSRCLDPNYNYKRFYTDFNIFDELENNYNEFTVDDLLYRAELSWKPIKQLEVAGLVSGRFNKTRVVHNVMDDSNQANAYRAGTDALSDNSTVLFSNSLLYTDPDDPTALPVSILPVGGIMYQTDQSMKSEDYRITATYKDVFKEKHVVNAMGGAELEKVYRTATQWTGWGYQYKNGGLIYTPYLWQKMCEEENTPYFSNTFSRTNTVAFYGTASYSYDYKYTLNGTLRYEGTNRLGKARSARWLPTWNVSGAYDMYMEEWMNPVKEWLSQANWRASYSLTADTGPSWVTNAEAVFEPYNIWRPGTGLYESAISLSYLANRNLTYEKKHEFNFGLDLGFLNDRIVLNTDVYWRNQFDLIGTVFTQGVGGEISKYANVADMKSNGYEFTVSTVNINTKKFRWTSDLIYSHSETKITDLVTHSRAIDLVTNQGYAVKGYPVRSVFSYQFTGLNEEGLPTIVNELGYRTDGVEDLIGNVNMQDTESDGHKFSDYLVYEGPSDPTYFGSFNNSFTWTDNWGRLQLDVYFTYQGGNVSRLDPVFRSGYSDLVSLPREFKNRWVVPGDEKKTTIPVIASVSQSDRIGSYDLSTAYNAYNYSTVRIAKGDFGRLKEVAVTYSLPKNWAEAAHLGSASLKLSATNLTLLWADKKLNGQDPEFFNAGGVASPLSKQFTATLRIGFGGSDKSSAPARTFTPAPVVEDNSAELASLQDQLAACKSENEALKKQSPATPAAKTVEKEVVKYAFVPVSIFYELDSDQNLEPGEVINLKSLAEAARQNPSMKVYLTGYADRATGNVEYNQNLSQRRAENIAQQLEKLGVARSRMVVSGKGGVADLDEVSHNRRVVVELK